MRILLIGEYSNVHATLAEGLRALGQQVTVVSNGDFWKDYPRDIDLSRRPGKWGGLAYLAKTMATLHKLRGYDVVQLINPMFLLLKAERIYSFYNRFPSNYITLIDLFSYYHSIHKSLIKYSWNTIFFNIVF